MQSVEFVNRMKEELDDANKILKDSDIEINEQLLTELFEYSYNEIKKQAAIGYTVVYIEVKSFLEGLNDREIKAPLVKRFVNNLEKDGTYALVMKCKGFKVEFTGRCRLEVDYIKIDFGEEE